MILKSKYYWFHKLIYKNLYFLIIHDNLRGLGDYFSLKVLWKFVLNTSGSELILSVRP